MIDRPQGLAISFALSMLVGGISSHAAVVASRFGQPANERQTQKALPQSKAPLWTTLAHTKISEDVKRGVVTASFPPDVRALNGKVVTLTGFMLPLDTSEQARHFLLSKYTPVCFFCPPGWPNEVVEVTSTNGIPVSDAMISVKGRLTMADNGRKGLIFRMDQASAR